MCVHFSVCYTWKKSVTFKNQELKPFLVEYSGTFTKIIFTVYLCLFLSAAAPGV